MIASLYKVGPAAAAGVISPKVAALTEGVVKAMFLTKLKIVLTALLTLAVAGTAIGVLTLEARSPAPVVPVEPKTGKDISPGYVLKASVAPAASAVAFGPHRAFAPLTDGTVLLLSLPH